MTAWVRVHSSPVRQFYTDNRALPFLDPKQDKRALLTDAGSLKSSSGGENAAGTLTLNNKAGQGKGLFANTPLGVLVELFDDDELQFEGTISTIALDPDCKVQVDA